jgi:hypothetical protein
VSKAASSVTHVLLVPLLLLLARASGRPVLASGPHVHRQHRARLDSCHCWGLIFDRRVTAADIHHLRICCCRWRLLCVPRLLLLLLRPLACSSSS